jgi:N-acylglucosamine 2-epimerase/mannose-6-phosphate isomerase
LYGRLSGAPVPEAESLVAFAEQHGVDPATAATFNQIRADGTPLDRSSRTWPNTERIKGHLALFELTSRDPRPAVLGSVRLLLDRYLAVSPRGSWMDVFDADGRPTASAVPTSTLYHVFLAFAELVRLEPRLVQKYAIL